MALQRAHDADFLRDVIGSMLEEADRLTRLVDCMLRLARAESGRMEFARMDVDLTAEAGAALDLVRVLAEEKRQTVVTGLGEPAIVRGDPAMLRQALLNLLDNAIRYTPHGGRIRLAAGRDDEGNRIVEVEDDGPGIAPKIGTGFSTGSIAHPAAPARRAAPDSAWPSRAARWKRPADGWNTIRRRRRQQVPHRPSG